MRVVIVLSCLSVVLVVAGVPTAALAGAVATAIGWLFWRVWSHRQDDGSFPAPPPLGPDHRPDGAERRPGESILRYLRWLAGPQ